MNNSGWNMYVFRDGKRTVNGSELISGLVNALRRWLCSSEHESEDCALGALIAAGELECALSDGASGLPLTPGTMNPSCIIAAEITESLAQAYLTGQRHSLPSILEKAEHIQMEARYEVAVQEGFAYYALHPRKIATVLDHISLRRQMSVIGIRSIGVTLSAVACAALRLRGVQCRRITVRPTGHPYDRSLEITSELSQWIDHSRDAGFLVTDEGPGISGSSFLSVAEALVQCGVAAERIHLIGSRAVDPATLRAPDAARRWTRYNVHIMQSEPLPPAKAGKGLSGGFWRRHFPCGDGNGPASWAPLEPAKFLASDERSIFKFEGFGRYGEAIGARAKLLADRGFAPQYLGNHCGFGQYGLLAGRAVTVRDLSPELLGRMADYIVLRSVAFTSETPQTAELEKMLHWNWQNEFGEELTGEEAQLRTERIAVCDGRMMPHEWFRTDHGELLKLDAVSHGDNHFFPGPCDVAWDVAGAIVEWEMQGEVRDWFVREYESRSGDTIAARLEPYLLAYAIFCLGWSKMAALAMQGEYDEALLERDYQRYRAFAARFRQRQRPLDSVQRAA
jgi:hypothetical protein